MLGFQPSETPPPPRAIAIIEPRILFFLLLFFLHEYAVKLDQCFNRGQVMTAKVRLPLTQIEQQVCDVTSEQLGIPRQRVLPSSSLVEDLGCDSMDIVELIMSIEERFSIALPNDAPNPVYKAVFTRQPFRISDLAELVYLQQGTGTPERKGWRHASIPSHAATSVPFTQLDGRWQDERSAHRSLLEPIHAGAIPQYRRRSDGMRCLLIPAASPPAHSHPARQREAEPSMTFSH